MENDFAEEIKKRGEDFKYFKDQVNENNDENDMDNSRTEDPK